MKTQLTLRMILMATVMLNLQACGRYAEKPKSDDGSGKPLTGNGDERQGWSSSGGGVIMDGTNPWFLAENTPEVTYCIKTDELNFGVSIDVIDQQIQQSLAFWERTFKSSGVLRLPKFQRQTCDDKKFPIITFLMGSLGEPQKAALGDPRKYVAATIRTKYDEMALRGEGFVYVSPERGPLAPNAAHINPKRWEGTSALRMVLMHEIGHVLGFGHSYPVKLMDELFPESVSSTNVALAREYEPDIFVFTKYISETCIHNVDGGSRRLDSKFFGIPDEHVCRKVMVTNDGFEVFSKPSREDEQWKVVGAASFDAEETLIDVRESISIFLTDKQTVFSDKFAGRNALGPWIKTISKRGTYRSSDGQVSRRVSGEMTLNRATISGILGDDIVTDILGR